MLNRMIEVDISNVWGDLALPDLLAMEKNVFDAHMQLTEDAEDPFPFRKDEEELLRIRKAAERIRSGSEVCLVVGADSCCQGARAAMELLQGAARNIGRKKGDPQIFFTGNSFSTRQWKELTGLLEEKDLSVIVMAEEEMAPETAIAFRSLRWLLERKYGTDEAGARICAVTGSRQSALYRMAQDAGWETFDAKGGILSAAGLLPLAVAGMDPAALAEGAADAAEHYDLRSYENPVWLYAAVRSLLARSGERIELPAAFAAGFRSLGLWWQRIFCRTGSFPAAAELPADLRILDQISHPRFETLLRFAPGEEEVVIGSDWKDLDGLNGLAGKTLAAVEEQAFLDTAAAHADAGIPVITMDCGPLNERTLGELFCFLGLACGICGHLPS